MYLLPTSPFIPCDKNSPQSFSRYLRQQRWLPGCCEGQRPCCWLLFLCPFPSGSCRSNPLGHWYHTLLREGLVSGPWEGALAPWFSKSQEEKANDSGWQSLNSTLTVTQSSYLPLGFDELCTPCSVLGR